LFVGSCLTTSLPKSLELVAAQGLQRGLAHLCGMQGPQHDHHLVVDAGAAIDLPTNFVKCSDIIYIYICVCFLEAYAFIIQRFNIIAPRVL